jgi:YVTN family beta-propeller protein
VVQDRVVGLVTVGNKPLGIDVTPDGKYVYVTNSNDGTVSVINTATNTNCFRVLRWAEHHRGAGRPLSVANDAALTPLGFGQFVDFNGGTLKTTGDLVTSRTISLLAQGGTIDTNGFNATFSGNIINSGSLDLPKPGMER